MEIQLFLPCPVNAAQSLGNDQGKDMIVLTTLIFMTCRSIDSEQEKALLIASQSKPQNNKRVD